VLQGVVTQLISLSIELQASSNISQSDQLSQICPPVGPNRGPIGVRLAFCQSRIESGCSFYNVNRILDHQSYNIGRVNLNINEVGLSEDFISSESSYTRLLI